MSFDKKLAKAKKLWNTAKSKKPDFDNVITDGIYVGKLTRAELGESQSKGRLQVAWRVVVASGEYKGENINWWSGLETENNVMYFQRDLVRLGKEVPEDPTDLEDVLKELTKEKPTIRVQVKTNGEFQNVRILKLVESEESEGEESEEETEEEEEEEPEETEAEESEEEEEDDDEEEKKDEKSKEEDDEEEDDEEDEEDEEDDEEESGDDEEEDEEKEEAPEVEVGMRVSFSHKGKDLVGTVKEIDYKKELVKIETDKGNKYKVAPDALSPAPQTKVKKSK